MNSEPTKKLKRTRCFIKGEKLSFFNAEFSEISPAKNAIVIMIE